MCKDFNNLNILNVCSSDEIFYRTIQPFIYNNLLKPLKENNNLLNLDIKPAKGVDLVCDCCNMSIIEDKSYDAALFCSGIEHIKYPKKAISEIKRVLKKNGILIISAPGVYPKHDDPIDTLLRFPNKNSWLYFLDPRLKIIDYKKRSQLKLNLFIYLTNWYMQQ